MTFFSSKEKAPPVIYFIITALPFLLFYWMCPFVADLTIGNDYPTYSIQNQMELLFSIMNGSFPLYLPGYALGQSSSAATLGQVFHPISHISSMLPGYWNGNALQWNTFIRLLSLGLTHMVLFLFLRKLKISTLFSFLLSCLTVYNLRMLDLFRYGAALEAYTGHLLLCAAIGFYFINPTKYIGPLSITVATYLIICSGHPQMMYYGLLGAGFFLLVAPFYISKMLPEKQVDFKAACRFWIQAGLYSGLGALLSLAYILPFYFEFIATNAERVRQSYTWADSIKDTFAGTINNFFMPLRSDVHGAFGGSSLIIIATLLPLMRCFKMKIPRAILVIWGVILLAFLYMQGARTPVHRLIWEYLPFASSFRYAGRISLIMPIFIMILLAWVAKSGSFSFSLRSRSVTLTPYRLLALVALLIVIGVYSLIAISLFSSSLIILELAHFTPVTIRKIPRLVEISVILSGMAALLALALYDTRKSSAKAIGILLCLVTLIQIGSVLKYGTWITNRRDTPSFKEMLAQKKKKLDYRFYPGTGMYSSVVATQLEQSFMEPFLGKIFYDVMSVSNIGDAYEKMLQGRTPQQVFVEGYELENNFTITAQHTDPGNGKVELVYSSFNRLQFRVFSPIPGFFGLSYPYTGHWNAWINGRKVLVYRANGSAHAVKIPKGESLIEFRYSSLPCLWGMVISCSTFTIMGLFVCIRAFKGIRRAATVIFVLVLGAGLFLLWQHSLYTSNDLDTEYAWTYKPPSPTPNLAYGKKTGSSSHLRGSPEYLHSSRAVDGERGQKTGFTTAPQDNPTWTVDLQRLKKIKTVILYESSHDSSINKRPLNIAFSEDGRQWRTVSSVISTVNPYIPANIFFEAPESARYIQIQASGFGSLRFDEIEVYGPEGAK